MPPTRAIHPTYTGPPLAPPQPPGGLSLNRAAATAPLAGFPAHGYPHYAHPYGVLQLPPHQQRPPYGAVIPGFFPPPSGMTLARPYPDPGVDPNGNAKSFPETLMDIINDERYHHIISWYVCQNLCCLDFTSSHIMSFISHTWIHLSTQKGSIMVEDS